MKCVNTKCGLTLDENWRFCPRCGVPILRSRKEHADNVMPDSGIRNKVMILEGIFEEFGVEAKCIGVEINEDGVSYKMLLCSGVRAKQVNALRDGIGLRMHAYRVRIRTPILGKGVCGIEVSHSPMDNVEKADFTSLEREIKSEN